MDQIEFLPPWEAGHALSQQSGAESCSERSAPEHPLYGCRPVAIARRGDNDGVLTVPVGEEFETLCRLRPSPHAGPGVGGRRRCLAQGRG